MRSDTFRYVQMYSLLVLKKFIVFDFEVRFKYAEKEPVVKITGCLLSRFIGLGV